jgi:hypothetical protein
MLDPHVHYALVRFSADWVTACQSKNCLIPHFLEWHDSVQSYRYCRGISLDWANRFNFDFTATFELLAVFNHAIVAAYKEKSGPEDQLLSELGVKVKSIFQQLQTVKPTVTDLAVVRLITHIEEYADLCNRQYASYVDALHVDLTALANMAKREVPPPSIGYLKALSEQAATVRPRAATVRPMSPSQILDLTSGSEVLQQAPSARHFACENVAPLQQRSDPTGKPNAHRQVSPGYDNRQNVGTRLEPFAVDRTPVAQPDPFALFQAEQRLPGVVSTPAIGQVADAPRARKLAVRQRGVPEGPPLRKRARAKTMQPGQVKQLQAAMAERSRAGNQFADFEFADDLTDK